MHAVVRLNHHLLGWLVASSMQAWPNQAVCHGITRAVNVTGPELLRFMARYPPAATATSFGFCLMSSSRRHFEYSTGTNDFPALLAASREDHRMLLKKQSGALVPHCLRDLYQRACHEGNS